MRLLPPLAGLAFGLMGLVVGCWPRGDAVHRLKIACVLVGIASDRFGPARVMLVGGVGLVASGYLLYLGVAAAPEWLLPLRFQM